MQIKRCVAPLKGQPKEKARITNHQWHLCDHRRERSLIIRQSESPPKIYSILTTNPQYPHKSSLEDVLKVMVDVSNIFYPTLTLPLVRGGNWIFIVSPLYKGGLRGVTM
jgi:hypothetical protein